MDGAIVDIAPSNFFVSSDTKRASKGTPNLMAIHTNYYLSLSLIDSQRKVSNVRLKIDPTEGDLWLNGADAAARGATAVGTFMSRIAGLSQGTVWARGVIMEDVDDTRAAPAHDADVYNFDKFTIGFTSGLDNYVMTIPARVDSQAMNSDGVNVLIDAGASTETADFITSFESLVVPKNGVTPPDVTYIKVNN